MGRKRVKPILIKAIPKEDINPKGFVEQLNYQGNKESLDPNRFRFKLICPCGSFRFYKSQDKKQVEAAGKCKPCLHKERRARRQKRNQKKVVRKVLEESL